MFPFWEVAVAPVLEAAGATKITEIGALAGENTQLILDRLGPERRAARDRPGPGVRSGGARTPLRGPVRLPPGPEPQRAGHLAAHGRRPDRRRPQLVHGVQRAAACSPRSPGAHGAPLPVLVLHDVCWPYGRRDLYYDARRRSPRSSASPRRQRGCGPARQELIPPGKGGLNPTMCNAARRGRAPQRGHDRPRRLRRRARPAAAAGGAADLLRPGHRGRGGAPRAPARARPSPRPSSRAAKGRTELLELAEQIRLRAMIFQHNVFFQRDEQPSGSTAPSATSDCSRPRCSTSTTSRTRLGIDHLTALPRAGRTAVPEPMLRDPVRHDQGPGRR